MPPARPHRVAAASLLLGAAVMAACAGRQPGLDSDPSRRITWPPPPAEARIEFVRAFSSPDDLGIRKAWISRLFSYLARGRQDRRMRRPYGVATTPGGIIAVADPDSAAVHLFDARRSKYELLTGPEDLPFASPIGVAPGPGGSLHISDSTQGLVFRYEGDGKWADPLGVGGELQRPTGLAWDGAAGLLYVVETAAHRISVFDGSGHRIRTIGSRGDGPGQFNFPVAAAVGPGGRLFVSDSLNFRVQILSPDGEYLGAFGRPGASPGDMDKSKGIAVDGDGHVYLADALHDVVQVFDDTGRLLTVIGGTGREPGQFWLPAGLFIDGEDRILVADSANGRIQILRYLGGDAGASAQ